MRRAAAAPFQGARRGLEGGCAAGAATVADDVLAFGGIATGAFSTPTCRDLLQLAGLMPMLADEAGPFVVLCPTEVAFQALPAVGEYSVPGMLADPAVARAVMTGHVVSGRERLTEGRIPAGTQLPTIGSDVLTVDGACSGVCLTAGGSEQARR